MTKRRNSRQDVRTNLFVASDSITITVADRFAADEILDLSTNIANLVPDGQHMQIKKVHVSFRASCEASFAMCPVLVQTAGTFSDTVDIANSAIDEILDQAINDKYGSVKIGTWKFSKQSPGDNPTSDASLMQEIAYDFDLPPIALQILQREQNAESLQLLKFGVVANARVANKTIQIIGGVVVDYTVHTKGLVLR